MSSADKSIRAFRPSRNLGAAYAMSGKISPESLPERTPHSWPPWGRALYSPRSFWDLNLCGLVYPGVLRSCERISTAKFAHRRIALPGLFPSWPKRGSRPSRQNIGKEAHYFIGARAGGGRRFRRSCVARFRQTLFAATGSPRTQKNIEKIAHPPSLLYPKLHPSVRLEKMIKIEVARWGAI